MKLKRLFLLFVMFPTIVIARDITFKKTLYWEKVEENIIEGKLKFEFLLCEPCHMNSFNKNLPEFIKKEVTPPDFSSLKMAEYRI